MEALRYIFDRLLVWVTKLVPSSQKPVISSLTNDSKREKKTRLAESDEVR